MSYRFFSIIPPGLESTLETELLNFLSAPSSSKIRKEIGGVSFTASLQEGIMLLEKLRTPSKILLRLGTKKLRRMKDIESLFNRANLQKLFPAQSSFSIDVYSQKSTLRGDIIKSKSKRILKALFPQNKNPSYLLQLRVNENQGVLSVQLNDGPLYKRGWRDRQGKASLRENLACALLILCNWKPNQPLLDPFCGSGTIPIEAYRMACDLPTRLSPQRNWTTLLPLKQHTVPPIKFKTKPLLIFGSDQEEQAILMSEENARKAAALIHWHKSPVEDVHMSHTNGVILTNPPYGLRLGKNVDSVYRKLGQLHQHTLPSWNLFFLTPHKRLAKLVNSNVVSIARFPQGGLWVDLYYAPQHAKP